MHSSVQWAFCRRRPLHRRVNWRPPDSGHQYTFVTTLSHLIFTPFSFTAFLFAHHQHAQLLHFFLAPLHLLGHQGLVHLHHSATAAKLFRGVHLAPSSYFRLSLPTPANSILKPTFLQDGSEQVFRPSNVQSKRMDDVGTRSIFTPEQVKLNVSGFGKKWRHLNPCSGHVQGVSQEVHAGYPCTSTGSIETCTSATNRDSEYCLQQYKQAGPLRCCKKHTMKGKKMHIQQFSGGF